MRKVAPQRSSAPHATAQGISRRPRPSPAAGSFRADARSAFSLRLLRAYGKIKDQTVQRQQVP